MPPASARRAGASLVSFITQSNCATRCQRQLPLHRFAPRSISSTSRRWQEPSAPSPAQARANVEKVQHELSPADESNPLRSLTDGFDETPVVLGDSDQQVDWTRSFHGLSAVPFTPEQATILQQELEPDDIEVKPDGIIYLPEIKYRRILNRAFGPGGWGLAPRGETIITQKLVTREYGLVAGGRLISVARGEQSYFDPEGIPTATEGCKSNAMMRCCKDLGVASELWDPRFIRRFLAAHARETFVEHVTTKKRRKHWLRKDDQIRYPFKEVGPVPAAPAAAAPAAATPAAKPGASYAAKPVAKPRT